MNVRTYGSDERLLYCREYLERSKLLSVKNIILLPIPTSRDGVTVTGTGKSPAELFSLDEFSSGEALAVDAGADFLVSQGVREDCGAAFSSALAVGYEIPKTFRTFFAERGACVIDVALDEVFLAENARLTAEGTLGKILSEEKAAPSELSIGIVGYGRIGKRLLHLLMFLGTRPTVFTGREELVRELGMIGVSAVSYDSLVSGVACDTLRGLDILINTAPAKIIDEAALDSLSGAKIIELASGSNFPTGASVLKLAAIPAKMYPKSAGRVLADSVLRILGE